MQLLEPLTFEQLTKFLELVQLEQFSQAVPGVSLSAIPSTPGSWSKPTVAAIVAIRAVFTVDAVGAVGVAAIAAAVRSCCRHCCDVEMFAEIKRFVGLGTRQSGWEQTNCLCGSKENKVIFYGNPGGLFIVMYVPNFCSPLKCRFPWTWW